MNNPNKRIKIMYFIFRCNFLTIYFLTLKKKSTSVCVPTQTMDENLSVWIVNKNLSLIIAWAICINNVLYFTLLKWKWALLGLSIPYVSMLFYVFCSSSTPTPLMLRIMQWNCFYIISLFWKIKNHVSQFFNSQERALRLLVKIK